MSVARSGLASLVELQHEMEEAAREIAEAEDEHDRERATRRYTELHDRIEHQDAYSIEHRVEEILGGLGFATADFGRAASTFSGGQQSRLMLAKLLLAVARPDAAGRALEPPRHRDDRLARELPVAAVGRHGHRQPRPLLPRQDRHQDLGAARRQDRRLSRQLLALLAAPRREGEGPPTARPSGRTRRSPTSRPTSASTAPASGPSRPTTARRSSRGSSVSRRCATSTARPWASARSSARATSSSRRASSRRRTTSHSSRTSTSPSSAASASA